MSPLKEIQTNSKILDFVIWAHKAGILSVVITCTICWILLTWVDKSNTEIKQRLDKSEKDNRICTNNQIYLLTNQLQESNETNKESAKVVRENTKVMNEMLDYLKKHD